MKLCYECARDLMNKRADVFQSDHCHHEDEKEECSVCQGIKFGEMNWACGERRGLNRFCGECGRKL